MTVVLIGGGWNDRSGYQAFLDAAGPDPTVACVVVDEGDGADYANRFVTVLSSVAPCRPRPVLVPLNAELEAGFLRDASALLVCGGLTPAYASALAPVADEIGVFLAAGRPFAGFSAGAAIAAEQAVVGGCRIAGRAVCPEDAAEDLDAVTVVPGLGLVPFAVDVHAAQWGTLGRLQAAVAAGLVPAGMAVDEDTALVVERANGEIVGGTVVGSGAVHLVRPQGQSVTVRTYLAGDIIQVPAHTSQYGCRGH